MQDTEGAASRVVPQQMSMSPGGSGEPAAPRMALQRARDAAHRVGPDILVAAMGWDPTSVGQVLFVPPSVSGTPVSPVRLRSERSLLPHALKHQGPLLANDLVHLMFDEERELRRTGVCAYLAVPVGSPGWEQEVVLFASNTVRRFDAITVATLLAYLEEGESADPRSRILGVVTASAVDENHAVPGGCRDAVIGESPEFLEICRLVAVVAPRDTTVLIQGESGTGKELIAKTIHRYSNRADRPFIRVNCAALAEALIESEMFGHTKGAFTGAVHAHKGRFEVAHGGTLLLDEIGNMSLSGQAKLLRVLQEREFEPVGQSESVRVDVRVISTTNINLEHAIAEGSFRRDLYFRLAVVPFTIPPLRERRKDILPIAEHFLAESLRAARKPPMGLSAEVRQLLCEYDWPGNAREVRNAMDYAVLVVRGNEIRPENLPNSIAGSAKVGSREDGMSLRSRMRRFEREVVLEALQRAQGVRKETARLLGIDPRNVSYLLRRHGIR